MSRAHDDPLLGWYVVTIAAVLDAIVCFRGFPPGVDGQIISSVILVAWNGLAAIVVQYRYGATSQSARQAELLAAATPAAPQPNVAQVVSRTEKGTP